MAETDVQLQVAWRNVQMTIASSQKSRLALVFLESELTSSPDDPDIQNSLAKIFSSCGGTLDHEVLLLAERLGKISFEDPDLQNCLVTAHVLEKQNFDGAIQSHRDFIKKGGSRILFQLKIMELQRLKSGYTAVYEDWRRRFERKHGISKSIIRCLLIVATPTKARDSLRGKRLELIEALQSEYIYGQCARDLQSLLPRVELRRKYSRSLSPRKGNPTDDEVACFPAS